MVWATWGGLNRWSGGRSRNPWGKPPDRGFYHAMAQTGARAVFTASRSKPHGAVFPTRRVVLTAPGVVSTTRMAQTAACGFYRRRRGQNRPRRGFRHSTGPNRGGSGLHRARRGRNRRGAGRTARWCRPREAREKPPAGRRKPRAGGPGNGGSLSILSASYSKNQIYLLDYARPNQVYGLTNPDCALLHLVPSS